MENNTVTEVNKTTVSETGHHTEKTIAAPVLIIFAEYLGYVSRFNNIAIDWCEGKVPEEYIQNIIIMEAKSIFRQMKKDYTLEQIQYWYDTYRPVIIGEYEDKLAKLIFTPSEYDDD